MPTKKDEPKAKTSAERVKESSEANAKAAAAQSKATRADRERDAALRQAEQDALINKPRRVKPDPEGDIDQRMAALLEDHKRMGAR
jgi:hypothetical protein